MNNPNQDQFIATLQVHSRRIAYDAVNGVATAQKLVTVYREWYCHPTDSRCYERLREAFRAWEAARVPTAASATS